MKREILFRGKSNATNKWVKGGFTLDSIGNPRITTLDFSKSGLVFHEVIPETIGQFTGLTDKNGVKIFEGDILEDRYYPLGANPKAIKYYKIGVVVYRANYFGLQLKIEGSTILDTELADFHHKNKREIYKHPNIGENWVDKLFCDSRDLEIIGNIHDNTELLNNE